MQSSAALRRDQRTDVVRRVSVLAYLAGGSSAATGTKSRAAQAAVTALFQSMQDDPAKFADLQRAKYIMGLGQSLTGEVTSRAGRSRIAAWLMPESGDRDR